MIQPTKYMDLQSSVLNVAAEILQELQATRAIALDELDGLIRSRLGDSARFNFLPALNLLFLSGRLHYDESSDAVVSELPRKTGRR